jgi:predicted DNA-binding protein (UPF0251 family)
MANKTTRPRGFAPWSPEPASLAIVEMIKAVLDEYAEHLPLTMRQVFYRLVGTRGFAKTEKAYKQLLEIGNRARRSGLIDFDAIRDDGVRIERPYALKDMAHGVRNLVSTAKWYRLDRQKGQWRRLLVMCEAAGMVPQLVRVCDPYSVPVHSSGGFDSVTAKHDLAQQIVKDRAGGTLVLHIGDHDPAGVHVFSSMAQDVKAFVQSLHGKADFQRLAVTPQQIIDMRLPTAPAKEYANRPSFSGVGDDPDATTQAEAIPPDELARIVEERITRHMDMDIYRSVLDREEGERQRLVSAASKLRAGMPGRPPTRVMEMDMHEREALVEWWGTRLLREAAKELKVSKSTLQRFLAKYRYNTINPGGRPRKAHP